MKEIFLAISNAIQANVEAIRWIDFDLGQLDEKQPPVSFPCVLIRFDNAPYVDLSQGGQQGEFNINLRIAFRKYERTHNKRTESFRELGFAHLDTLKEVHKAVNGLSGDNFTKLTRKNFNTETRSDLRVYNYSYETLLNDIPANLYLPISAINGATNPDLCINAVIKKGIGQMIIEQNFVVT